MFKLTWQHIKDAISDGFDTNNQTASVVTPPPVPNNSNKKKKGGQAQIVVQTPKQPLPPVTPMKPIQSKPAVVLKQQVVSNSSSTPTTEETQVKIQPTLPEPTAPRPVAPTVFSDAESKMNADGLFVIGSSHDVCQDYVTFHNNGIKSSVVLADGCSGSNDSDVGARLLVKTYEKHIPAMGVMDFNAYARNAGDLFHNIVKEAHDNATSLNLDPMALDATMLSIVSNKDGEFMATCYGDGVVALGRKDGIIEVYSVSYKEGYPNYLSYQLTPERKQKFQDMTSNYKEVTLELIDSGQEPVTQKYRSSTVYDVYLGSKKKYNWVAVLSDGVHSFMRKIMTDTAITQEPVPMHEIIKELFAFKNFQGTFVKRRVNRFLESCQDKKWTHSDDLSVGVIYLGDN